MSSKFSFSEMARRELEELVVSHQLSIVADEYEVLLRGESFVISFSLDRDGVNCMYYDLRTSNPLGYNLGMFLMNKREHLLPPPVQLTASQSMQDVATGELVALKRYLIAAGQDVLSGSKAWLSEYSWPSVKITDSVRKKVLLAKA